MTWTATVESHDLWNQVSALEAACGKGDWPDNADVRDLVARAQWLASEVRGRAESNANALTSTSLQGVRDSVSQTTGSLANVRSNPSAYVSQAHQYIDSTVQAMSPWPAAKLQRMVKSVTDASDTYQQEVERLLQAARDEVERLTEVVDQQQAGAKVSNDALKAEVEKTAKSLTDLGGRIDKQINEHAETFSTAEAARKDKAAEAQTEAASAAKEQRDADHAEAKSVLAGLNDMHGKARNTLESMGVEATTSFYSKYAEEQRSAANRWSFFTIVFGLVAAGVVLWTLHEFSVTSDPAWSLISLKSLAGLTLLGVAGYAGREAHGHRTEERRAKQRALALQALEPFLANVQSEDTDRLRLALAAELFADPTQVAAASAEDGLSVIGFVRDLARGRSSEANLP